MTFWGSSGVRSTGTIESPKNYAVACVIATHLVLERMERVSP